MTNAGVVTIGNDKIDSQHYAAGSIDNEHIADDAIDSEHYAAGSIDNEHIADDAIDSEHYTDGSIDTAHIADDAVTADKLANAINTSIDAKLPLAGGTLTGALTGTTATFSTADNLDTLTLTSTDADANAAPNLRMYRNSASPADGDVASQIDFEGRNDNSQDVVYGTIKSIVQDVSDGTEDGKIEINTMIGGSSTRRLSISSADSETVFNDDGIDLDFRVESDTDANALFLEGSTGNVGISTDDPNVSLHIDNLASGMPVTSGTEQTYGAFRIQNTNNNTLDFGFDQTNGAWLQTGYAPSLITDNVYSLLLNPNGGNVGIGTTSPQSTLDVGGGDVVDPILRIDSAAGGSPTLIFDASEANRGGLIKFWDNGSASGGFIDYLHNGDKMNFGSGSSTGITMTVNDGKVGIGDDSPSHTLDVAGGIVEQGGVLKENLLTNSGFDVWSNSTLENVGSVLNTNGTFEADDNWSTQGSYVTSHARASDQAHGGTYSWKIETTGTNSGIVQDTDSMFSVTAGKLYRFRAWVRCDQSTKAIEMGMLTTGCTGRFASTTFGPLLWTTIDTWHEMDVTLEATTSGTIRTRFMAQSSNITWWVDDFTVYEVTPGCVAADNLAMDGWNTDYSSTRPSLYREHTGSNTKDGSFYSLKIIGNETTANGGVYWPSGTTPSDSPLLAKIVGRTVTLGVWVYHSGTANKAGVRIADATGSTYAYHSGSAGWEWVELTKALSSASTSIRAGLIMTVAETAYFSQPMLVLGSSIGEGNYTRPQGEIIWFDNVKLSTKFGGSAFSDVATTTLNLETDSDGVIPKGAKAIMWQGHGRDSGCNSTDCYFHTAADTTASWQGTINPAGKADNAWTRVNINWQACDSNGDMAYVVNATGSSTFDIALYYNGVQLR